MKKRPRTSQMRSAHKTKAVRTCSYHSVCLIVSVDYKSIGAVLLREKNIISITMIDPACVCESTPWETAVDMALPVRQIHCYVFVVEL